MTTDTADLGIGHTRTRTITDTGLETNDTRALLKYSLPTAGGIPGVNLDTQFDRGSSPRLLWREQNGKEVMINFKILTRATLVHVVTFNSLIISYDS